MHRLIPLMLLAVVTASSNSLAGAPPLRPDTLLNWLRIIDIPNARLIYAADTNGYYFAVKVDQDGDILFCEYGHAVENRADVRSFSLDVLDSDGESLHDLDCRKKSPDTVEIEYRKESALAPADTYSSTTVAYSRGTVIPLRRHGDSAVVIKYVDTTGEKRVVLLSQRIALPQTEAEAGS